MCHFYRFTCGGHPGGEAWPCHRPCPCTPPVFLIVYSMINLHGGVRRWPGNEARYAAIA